MNAQPAPDRRAHPRYLCWVEVICDSGEQPHRPARLLDLSAAGARVALLAPLPRGADLRLTLPCNSGRPNVLSAAVSRIKRTSFGWEAGCTFVDRLTQEQLDSLLAPLQLPEVGTEGFQAVPNELAIRPSELVERARRLSAEISGE
jgi:hypothetical protein